MLLGIWKNIEDLEEHINLDELQLILEASRERERNNQRFMAAIQGIDIDKGEKDRNAERFEAIQQRVMAKQMGKSEEEIELDILGIAVEEETDED